MSQEKKEQHGPEGGRGHLLAHVALLAWRLTGTYCENVAMSEENYCSMLRLVRTGPSPTCIGDLKGSQECIHINDYEVRGLARGVFVIFS